MAACAVLAMPACSGRSRSTPARDADACPGEIMFHGRLYTGRIRDWHHVRLAGSRALMARPGACAAQHHPGPVLVWAVAGVPTSVAVSSTRPFSGELYIAPGQLVVLPRHPLHRAAFGDAAHPRLATPSCRRRAPERGRVLSGTDLGESIRVAIAGRTPLTIRLDSRTRIAGPPRLAAGTRVRVALRQCSDSNKPVAKAITRL
jgi:hypothetical protein